MIYNPKQKKKKKKPNDKEKCIRKDELSKLQQRMVEILFYNLNITIFYCGDIVDKVYFPY